MKLERAKIVVVAMTFAGMLFAAGAALWLVLPAYREVRVLASQIIDAQTELEAQYANRRHLLASIEELARVRAVVGKLTSQFLPAGQELVFITSVEEIAARHGVTERIRLSAAPPGSLEELNRSFELSLSGPFPDVLKAFLDVERLPSLLVIDAVSVNSNRADTPDARPHVTFLIRGALAAPPKNL